MEGLNIANKHIANFPSQELSPYKIDGRDNLVRPLIDQAVISILETATSILKDSLYFTGFEEGLVDMLISFSEILKQRKVQEISSQPFGWLLSRKTSSRAEAWPTLAVAELSTFAIEYLRFSILISLKQEHGFLVESNLVLKREFEAFSNLPFNLHSILESKYINRGVDAFTSAVLFGPPGTGKTTLVKSIAKKLGWSFVYITPADLAQDGYERIVYQAKNLLGKLTFVENSVILLDEFDAFIYTRETKEYDQWQSLITNCMLPLLADLRESKKSIFFMATNYVDKMDPAAIRQGRFDAILPVWPPDINSRKDLIKNKIGDDIDSKELDKLAKFSKYSSYGELSSKLDHSELWDETLLNTEENQNWDKQLNSQDLDLVIQILNDVIIGSATNIN